MDRIYKLEILPPAQVELEEIARLYMALSGTKYSRRITNRIYEALEQLTRFPLSGPVAPDEELSSAEYRFFAETVVVYHIPHGATDYPKLFQSL